MENKEPKISVIVPVYNVFPYLEKCVSSIVSQTFENMEILLIDDGSTDGSGELCQKLALQDERIRVIHKRNGGLSSARNLGLKTARGQFISFIDSDDFLDPNFLAQMSSAIIVNKAQMAVCSYDEVKENGELWGSTFHLTKERVVDSFRYFNLLAESQTGEYTSACNKMYTRRALKGVAFPEGKVHEDEFVCHRIAYNCDAICMVDQTLYHYVKRDGSITAKKSSARRLHFVEALADRIHFYNEVHYYETMESTFDCMTEFYFSLSRSLDKNDKGNLKQTRTMIRECGRLVRTHARSIKAKCKCTFPIATQYFKAIKRGIKR